MPIRSRSNKFGFFFFFLDLFLFKLNETENPQKKNIPNSIFPGIMFSLHKNVPNIMVRVTFCIHKPLQIDTPTPPFCVCLILFVFVFPLFFSLFCSPFFFPSPLLLPLASVITQSYTLTAKSKQNK